NLSVPYKIEPRRSRRRYQRSQSPGLYRLGHDRQQRHVRFSRGGAANEEYAGNRKTEVLMRQVRAFLLTVAIFLSWPTAAQQVGTNATSGQSADYTFKANSQLVIENVVVKDKNGNFIDGLTARDFTVSEDGAPQTIRFCEH